MKPLHRVLAIVALACLAAIPLGVTNTYYLHLIETIMIYSILPISTETSWTFV
jgi:branched-chain amino acid transport system permease protein